MVLRCIVVGTKPAAKAVVAAVPLRRRQHLAWQPPPLPWPLQLRQHPTAPRAHSEDKQGPWAPGSLQAKQGTSHLFGVCKGLQRQVPRRPPVTTRVLLRAFDPFNNDSCDSRTRSSWAQNSSNSWAQFSALSVTAIVTSSAPSCINEHALACTPKTHQICPTSRGQAVRLPGGRTLSSSTSATCTPPLCCCMQGGKTTPICLLALSERAVTASGKMYRNCPPGSDR